MRRAIGSLSLGLMVLFASAVGAAEKPAASGETPTEKLRKALDRVRDVDIQDQPLDTAVNHLREQTGINFVIDQAALAPAPNAAGFGLKGSTAAGYPSVRDQFHHQPVRIALAKLLRDHGLTHVLVGDTVLITTPQKAIERQLRQPVSLNIENSPLSAALKHLGRETGANLVLDPRSAREGQKPLSLRLDEVPLETAVELLADEAGLSAVRLHNVLYVTSEGRAEKMRKARPAPVAAESGGWRVWPDGKGGFRTTPPTIGRGGGISGLGGIGGIAGLGGGGFNQLGAGGGFQGNFQGGRPAAPIPLTPPLPKTEKQTAPDKPKSETPSPAKAAPKEKSKSRAEKLGQIIDNDQIPGGSRMSSILPRPGCFLLCLALMLADGTPALQAGESTRGQELRQLLSRPVKFTGYDDPKVTLSEALESMSKRYNLSFNLNEDAFEAAHIEDVGKSRITASRPVPEMHTRLSTVLKKILIRVSPSATYVIRDDMIEITTEQARRKEFFADRPDGPFSPLVAGSFDKVPLAEALKELAHHGNIVLDARASKEGQMLVTADLVNVPLDTAVRMLADMAGLKVVSLDNALYVTNENNARLMKVEREERRAEREARRLRRQREKRSVPDFPRTDPSKKTASPGERGV